MREFLKVFAGAMLDILCQLYIDIESVFVKRRNRKEAKRIEKTKFPFDESKIYEA